MTPDDKKRIEEIRRGVGVPDSVLSGTLINNDIRFLLAQLDEAHAALRKIVRLDGAIKENPHDVGEEWELTIGQGRKVLGEE